MVVMAVGPTRVGGQAAPVLKLQRLINMQKKIGKIKRKMLEKMFGETGKSRILYEKSKRVAQFSFNR